MGKELNERSLSKRSVRSGKKISEGLFVANTSYTSKEIEEVCKGGYL